MKGTAQRTEKLIMCDTPGATDMSVPIMAITMATDIGIETSQNSLHSLMALCCSTALKSILICFDNLQGNTGYTPIIFSFHARLVAHADRP